MLTAWLAEGVSPPGLIGFLEPEIGMGAAGTEGGVLCG